MAFIKERPLLKKKKGRFACRVGLQTRNLKANRRESVRRAKNSLNESTYDLIRAFEQRQRPTHLLFTRGTKEV